MLQSLQTNKEETQNKKDPSHGAHITHSLHPLHLSGSIGKKSDDWGTGAS